MNKIKEYRKENKLTQSELAEELQKIDKSITRPVISLMERGLVIPNTTIEEYIENKACIQENNKGKNNNKAIMPIKDENRLKTKFERIVYEELKESPKSKLELMYITGKKGVQVRAIIRDLRNRGMWIICDSDDKYKLTDDPNEVEAWLKSYLSRANSEYRTAQAMRNNNDGQMGW